MSGKFANLVISAAQYGLAAGAAAQGTKGASKGAGAAGLFFMLLGLSFFLCLDYNGRFGGLASDLGPGSIIKFLGAAVLLTASGFIPYVVISQKSKKFQRAAGGISVAIYVACSMLFGIVLGKVKGAEGVAQSVILTNMYVLLGSILGMNAQEAKGNKSAMANAIMAAVGFVLLTAFDFTAPVANAEAKAAAVAPAAETPAVIDARKAFANAEEKAASNLKAFNEAQEPQPGNPNSAVQAAKERLKTTAEESAEKVKMAKEALEALRAQA